jgi:DNA-directed RNA polymerase subunit omega
MARITVEDCLKNINNRFILVHMSDIRTRQLLKGSQPLVAASDNREVVRSLREIAAGKVFLDAATIENLRSKNIIDTDDK